MCGIAGELSLRADRPVGADGVKRMLAALRHRGPDSEGTYGDPMGRIALGMRRLAIVDLFTGEQPIFNEDRSVACVFNGEIYNFLDLRRELEAGGHIFRSQSDTEVIVHLYEEAGVRCVDRLRGMFAFAIWDERAGMLMLARDRLGEKPLYYIDAGGRLAFASELDALVRLPGVPRHIDPEALDLYLTYSYVPAPHSIYRHIRKLPPAHVLTVRDGQLALCRYWRVPEGPPSSASRAELVVSLRAKLAESVRIRLMSDVPIGCFLSGGTDSSAVVALMAAGSPKPVKTFSIGFREARFNELAYARMVARHFGTEHFEYMVEPEAAAVLPELARQFGEPHGDASALPTWHLARLTRQHVTVALTGDGGDELFAGYPWYRNAARLDRLAGLTPAWATAAMARLPSPGDRLRRLGRRLAMTPAERFASLRSFLEEEAKRTLYAPALLAARGVAACRYLIDPYEAGRGDRLARQLRTDLMTYLPEDLLVKVDRMTMAHSLEARPPLLDHELVEFCARIPATLKLGAGGAKLIFRDAIRELFPPGFLERPKMGFSIPVASWLRHELRDTVARRLVQGPLAERGWFERRALQRVVDEHMRGTRNWSAQLWNLLMLAEWAGGPGAGAADPEAGP
jgi:asparagine synthase (glutamine-hydrolysing)